MNAVTAPEIINSIASPDIALLEDSKIKRYMPRATKINPNKTERFGCEVIGPGDCIFFADLELADAFRLCLLAGITNSLDHQFPNYRAFKG